MPNLGNDLYFVHPFVSNSDLLRLLPSAAYTRDLRKAFAEGTLLDAMETTPMSVDFMKLRIIGYDYDFTQEQFDLLRTMRDVLRRDKFYLDIKGVCDGQQEFYERGIQFEHEGFSFGLDCRIKYDLWSYLLGWGADIKTTAATCLIGFMNSIHHYHYDQQRAFYMTVSGARRDVVIGVSKVWPHKIFIVKITHGDNIFLSGHRKMSTLAHQYLLQCNQPLSVPGSC